MDLHRFLLLLPLTLCLDSQNVVLQKRIGSEEDVTPVCTSQTDSYISTIYCKIEKRNSSMHSCSLGFVGKKFVNGCGSRIVLKAQNQTVFLHLMDLTPEDSGMFSCECNRRGHASQLTLNITVEANELQKYGYSSNSTLVSVSVAAFIVACGIIGGCIYKRIRCRQQSRSAKREDEEMDPYATLRQPNKDLYQTIGNSAGVSGSRHQREHKETEYENIQNFAN